MQSNSAILRPALKKAAGTPHRPGAMQSQAGTILSVKQWRIALLTFLVFAGITATSFPLLPGILQDEVQITDYGRLFLNADSEWSANWLIRDDKPLYLWTYIGPAISELSFQVFGGAAPRFASLAGAVVSAILMLLWLKARRLPFIIALGLSTAFSLDPLFNLSQRMGRVDAWVFAAILGACLLLRLDANANMRKSRVIMSGALAGLAAMIWPSAVFLFPLVIAELYATSSNALGDAAHIKRFVANMFLFGLTAVITVVLLLLPVWILAPEMLGTIGKVIQLNTQSSASSTSKLVQVFSIQPWLKIVKAMVKTLSPFLPLIGFLGAVRRPDKSMIIGTCLAILLMVLTLVYEFRVLMLLPYFAVLSTGLFNKVDQQRKTKQTRFAATALAIVVGWGMCISVFTRTFLSYAMYAQTNRSNLDNAAETIGNGNYKVLLGFTYELYYTGRKMGWQTYIPYIQYDYDKDGNWIRKPDYQPDFAFRQLLSRMDYAIFEGVNIDGHLGQVMKQSGFVPYATFQPPIKNKSIESTRLSRLQSVFYHYLQGKDHYGPYIYYKRIKAVQAL